MWLVRFCPDPVAGLFLPPWLLQMWAPRAPLTLPQRVSLSVGTLGTWSHLQPMTLGRGSSSSLTRPPPRGKGNVVLSALRSPHGAGQRPGS